MVSRIVEERELTVEAGMRTGQSLLVAIVTVNIEPAEPVHALELAKAIKRDLASSGDELKKFSSLFLIEGAYSAPEPLDL